MKSQVNAGQFLILNIAKFGVLIVILIFVHNVFSQTFINSEATAEDLEKAILKVEGEGLKGSEKGTVMDIKRNFSLESADIKDSCYYKPVSNMDVTELLIVKASSRDGAENVKDAVKKRIDKQKKVFQGYAPKQYDRLSKAKVIVNGRFVLYIVSNNADAYISAFLNRLKRG